MAVAPGTKQTMAKVGRRGLLAGAALAALTVGDSVRLPAAGAAPNPLADPRVRTAHLFRRAGFGATPEELDQFTAMGYDAAVDWLLTADQRPDAAETLVGPFVVDPAKPEGQNREALRRWWLLRMRYTDRPLHEKMTLFWHGLLTSGFRKVNSVAFMHRQNEFLRANALGNFQTLLVGIAKDPAMLQWLDGNNSRRRAPNENFARELLELFSMGIGHYTEHDVREAARAFTGWSINREMGEAQFNPRQWDDGVKTFLGHTGRWDGNDIIDIVVRQRATAEYVSRRIFAFLAYRDPEPATVARLADVFTASGYNVRMVVREVLLSPEFSSARAYRALVKSPVELVVGALRALDIDTDGEGLPYQTRVMGQDLFDPPNVAGWPGGAAWLTSAFWLRRVNFVNAVVTRRRGPQPQTARLAAAAPASPADLVGRFADLLVDGVLAPERRAIIEAVALADAPETLTPQYLNRQGRHLLYLLLGGPEYQLA